jgi:hypothetical protein
MLYVPIHQFKMHLLESVSQTNNFIYEKPIYNDQRWILVEILKENKACVYVNLEHGIKLVSNQASSNHPDKILKWRWKELYKEKTETWVISTTCIQYGNHRIQLSSPNICFTTTQYARSPLKKIKISTHFIFMDQVM